MEKTTTCPICKAAVCGLDKLGPHIQEIHTCSKCSNLKLFCTCPHKCQFLNCLSEFGKKEDLKKHYETNHICSLCQEIENCCSCNHTEFSTLLDNCPKSFLNEYDNVDATEHLSAPTAVYSCQECNNTFGSEDDLANHILCDHVCHVCNLCHHDTCEVPLPPQGQSVSQSIIRNKRKLDEQQGGSKPKIPRLDNNSSNNLGNTNIYPSKNPYDGIIDVTLLRSKYCPACDIEFPFIRDLQQHLVQNHSEYYEFSETVQIGMGTADRMNLVLTQTAFNSYHNYTCNLKDVVAKDVEGVFHSLLKQVNDVLKKYLLNWNTFKVQFSIEILISREVSDEHGFKKKVTAIRTLNGFMFPILNIKNVNVAVKVTIDHLKERISEFTQYGSGWKLDKILQFSMMLLKYDPFFGGAREDLPTILRTKYRTLISVPADDDLCFARAVYAHPDIHKEVFVNNHGNDKLQTKLFYKNKIFNGKINWKDINFPFSLKQVDKFEKQNPNIALTIIGFSKEFCEKRSQRKKPSSMDTIDQCIQDVIDMGAEAMDTDNESSPEEEVFKTSDYRTNLLIREHCVPLHIPKTSTRTENKTEIDLLLLLDNEGSEHFVFIKSLHSLLSTRKTKHICRHCLQCFNEDYDTHIQFCASLGMQKTIFPEKDHLKFEKFCRTQKAPFTIIADFEAFPVPTGNVIVQDPNDPQSETIKIATHEPCGYSWMVLNWEGKVLDQNVYRLTDKCDAEGKKVNDVAQRFLTEILVLNKEYQEIMKYYEQEAKKTMNITQQDQATFRKPSELIKTKCYFCHNTFTRKDIKEKKVVRHHCHLPPYNFEGFAHQSCNALASIPKQISVIFHNLKGYDGHFLIQAATSDIVEEIEVIPQTGEKFMSIIVNKQIKFIDSALFMPESLDGLVKNMDKDQDFDILYQTFKGEEKDKVGLLLQKGAYPYSYMSSVEKFSETALPCREHFRNDLTRKRIDNDVWRNANKVWKAFEIQDLGEWHDLYVKCDTALLACVWFKLRNCLHENYGLDVNHYFSLPMFSLDASLKMTKVELEFIKDPTMHVWFESAVRGGLVSAGDLRVAKANNKFLPDYNKKKPTSYIVYWDANNLYGTALSQYLPYGDFKWANDEEMKKIREDPRVFVLGDVSKGLKAIGNEDETGWFFEVDLEVPSNLHEELNAYPPAPCKRVVTEEDISYMQHELGLALGVNLKSKETRLIADLRPKHNYVCHFRALRRWLQLGVVITKVHRAVKFTQKPWMKPFVDYNTTKRQQATSEIDKKFYKLMNNTGYGKLIEQKRDRRNIQIVLSEEKALRLNRKPTVDHVTILDNNTVLLTMKRVQVTLDRPVAAGVAVLDISKVIMFDFHYDFIVPKYRGHYNLLYTDTDSLIYLIQTENVYDDCLQHENEFFDMSEYNPNDPILGKYYSSKNKKRLGYFTDETPHGIISEVVINKPKMYCVRTIPTENIVNNNGQYELKKRAKGIGKSAVENDITFENYVNAIDPSNLSEAQTFADTKSIRSFKHLIFTIESRKKAINSYDVKRYSPDGIVTLAYGHKDIPLYENVIECNDAIDIDNVELEARHFCRSFIEACL